MDKERYVNLEKRVLTRKEIAPSEIALFLSSLFTSVRTNDHDVQFKENK